MSLGDNGLNAPGAAGNFPLGGIGGAGAGPTPGTTYDGHGRCPTCGRCKCCTTNSGWTTSGQTYYANGAGGLNII